MCRNSGVHRKYGGLRMTLLAMLFSLLLCPGWSFAISFPSRTSIVFYRLTKVFGSDSEKAALPPCKATERDTIVMKPGWRSNVKGDIPAPETYDHSQLHLRKSFLGVYNELLDIYCSYAIPNAIQFAPYSPACEYILDMNLSTEDAVRGLINMCNIDFQKSILPREASLALTPPEPSLEERNELMMAARAADYLLIPFTGVSTLQAYEITIAASDEKRFEYHPPPVLDLNHLRNLEERTNAFRLGGSDKELDCFRRFYNYLVRRCTKDIK